MISKARARFIRISPRKVRQVANLIRGKGANEALAVLSNVPKSAAVYLNEVVQSAISNAKRKEKDLAPADLYIARLTVDGGPSMVRYRSASMGRASMIRKRTSHINIELDIKEEAKKKMKEKVKSKKGKA